MSPRPPDSFEEEMAQLADDYAQAWRFETDGPRRRSAWWSASVSGTPAGVLIRSSACAWRTAPSGLCTASTKCSSASSARPGPGSGSASASSGSAPPRTRRIIATGVRVDRPEGHEIDWSRYGSGVEELPPARSAPPTPGELAAAAQIGDPGAPPVLDDGEDSPFFWTDGALLDERRCHGSRW